MSDSIATIRTRLAKALEAAGIDNAMNEAKWLMMGAAHISESDFIINSDRILHEDEVLKLEEWLRRRLNHEPLSRIRGIREFWSLDFILNDETLDPRPDSEILVETALRYMDQSFEYKIADLGTGTGCLILSILNDRPSSLGVGVDRSFKACEAANLNAERLGLSDRFLAINSSWTEALSPHKFDIIISNPPYIAVSEKLEPNVSLYDPKAALYAGSDGLDAYRAISKTIANIMHDKSILVLEIGHTQRKAVSEIFASAGLKNLEIIKDLEERDRCLVFGVDKPIIT